MQNLGEFLKENSQKYQDRIAYQIKRGLRTQRFSFEDIYLLSLKTATFLQQKGLKKGDKVVIWAPNMPEYPILYFGIWLMGAVAVPIDIRTTEETLKIFLEKAKCQIGFKGKFIPGSFGRLVKESFRLEDLVDLVHLLPTIHYPLPATYQNDLAEIAFTSGTTGTPKGVMLTHGNFLSDVEALTKAFPFKKEWHALSLLPLSHAFEQVVDFLAPFQSGITVTYLERINTLTILKTMRKSKITSVALVPQVLRLLMNGIERRVAEDGKTAQFQMANRIAPILPVFLRRLLFSKIHQNLGGKLKFFGSGSAPLDLKLAQKWEALGVEIFEGYGATETTAALTINTPSARHLGSVGKILPKMEVRINPETHEIEAHGPNISLGYFEDEEKTKAAFCDGWYRTGDVGKLDKNGYLYITGREAFRIVLPDGRKVYPEDLEKKLNAHPLVSESCVIGVKREEGETVHAAIITKYPSKLDTIIRDINQKLASHEQILEWSIWQGEDFPRTPILKIDRKKVTLAVSSRSHKGDKRSEEVKSQDQLISIISQITHISSSKIKETSTLGTDLKIDSLGRVELLSSIEQKFAVAISEIKISPQTSLKDLRRLIKDAPETIEEIPINEFLYASQTMIIRTLLQKLLVFPLHNIFVPIEVSGKENLKDLKLPAIFYFNHIAVMDGLCVLRVLPQKIRERLVIVVSADLWKEWRRFFIEIFGAAFPFDKEEKVKASLELTGEFLDRGFSILMAPEGTFSEDGSLLEFKPGIGLLATECQVPVVPIKIDPKYMEIFPSMEGKFIENLPKKRKRIWIKVGKPLTFAKDAPYEESTKQMHDALEKL
ncbi:AMP-binding protein [Candidatus Microgenomates bacterium]|nr:AMP-binding protein [Candidatus Microgenomates bacterium]